MNADASSGDGPTNSSGATNKLILSSLKNGPLREEIEKQGGLKLIYIDPPFDVGADFSMDIEIGSDTFTKKPNILEEIAYRDTWGKGADSFIAMIYERLVLMPPLVPQLARNFLVIAPNIIVLDRIYKDFQGLRIFLKDDPVLPDNGVDGRNWRDDFQLTLHVQDEVRIL
jgi:hypothetical protein